MNNIIIGTAGHVDHGKTCLIRARTGIESDRLREEKGRTTKPDLRNNGTPGEFERQALERMMAMEQEEHELERT